MLASDPVGATWEPACAARRSRRRGGWTTAVAAKLQLPVLLFAGAHDKPSPRTASATYATILAPRRRSLSISPAPRTTPFGKRTTCCSFTRVAGLPHPPHRRWKIRRHPPPRLLRAANGVAGDMCNGAATVRERSPSNCGPSPQELSQPHPARSRPQRSSYTRPRNFGLYPGNTFWSHSKNSPDVRPTSSPSTSRKSVVSARSRPS